MKVKKVTKSIIYHIEMEKEENDSLSYTHYKTDETGSNWEVLMEQYWEPIADPKEFQEALNEYKKKLLDM